MEASLAARLLFRRHNRCAWHLQKNKRNEASLEEPTVQVHSDLQEKAGDSRRRHLASRSSCGTYTPLHRHRGKILL